MRKSPNPGRGDHRSLGLIALGIAGYDAIYNWLDRADLRRREARTRRQSLNARGRGGGFRRG
ncbi:hypothetical protein ACTWPT_47065 [Nonomuraea sp. 3N208]|uniref:hypothetical protein n=1 Tax=Nonomuraea sp. 3N208 TaxID=3457421 RepID=UPI003FD2A469